MSEFIVSVVIPFRDRGVDPRRAANLRVVMAWWLTHGYEPVVVDDGLEGDAQFNRHRAYNRAVAELSKTDVFVFTEADMLIPPQQVDQAVRLAKRKPCLVVPFTQYRYLSDQTTQMLRDWHQDWTTESTRQFWTHPPFHPESVFQITPEKIMDNGRSIGAINVVSRNTLDITGGFTEATSGNWYDDNITEEGFAYLTGNKTAFAPGPAVHLYHLPGWTGDHLTREDRRATEFNRRLLETMRKNIREDRVALVQDLMAHRSTN